MHEDAPGVRSPLRRAVAVTITVRTLLIMSAFIAAGWAFVTVRAAFLALFLALFAALVLEPLVTFSGRRFGLRRGPAATIIVLGIGVLAILVTVALIAPFVDAARDFVDALPSIVQDIRNSSIGSWLDQHSQAPEKSQENVKQFAATIGHYAGGVLGATVAGLNLILGAVAGLFLTLFLLLDLPRIVGAVDSLLDPAGSARLQRITPAIITAVSRTMLGNILISVVCGTIYGLSAWALGAPFPLALGLLSGFLDLIPMVGATIAGAIVVLAALTQGVPAALIMLAIVLVYQQVENYLLQPTILGKAADVSGFLVIASVLVFGTLLGAAGAIIAVPIVAAIEIIAGELTASRRAAMADLRAQSVDPSGGARSFPENMA
jgi:predicted PurR-regulated permease PerM